MAETQKSIPESHVPRTKFAWPRTVASAHSRPIASLTLGLVLLCGCSSQPACPPNSQFPTYQTFPTFQQQPMTLPSGTTVPNVGAPMMQPNAMQPTMMQPNMMAPNGMMVPMTGQPPVYGQPITGNPPAYPVVPGQAMPPGFVPGMPPR